jgi:two-component system sensor histidine kinase DesK
MVVSQVEAVLPSRTLSRARLLTVVWLVSAVLSVVLLPLVGLAREDTAVVRTAGVVGVALFFAAQVLVMWSAVTPWATTRVHRRLQVLFVAVAVVSVPTVAPVAADQWATWAWLGASLIGTAPLMWSRSGAVVASLAALATSVAVAAVLDGEVFQYAAVTLSVGVGLAMVNLVPVWLWELLVRAEVTRQVAAQAAAADERNRFGRDVHDILGHDLTVMALKAELAARTALTDPDSSARESEGVRAIAESALAHLRDALAVRRRAVDVHDEVMQMAGILTAAGLSTDVEIRPVEASPSVAHALSMMVREATTNVLRHSDAHWCRIRLQPHGERVRLEVTNDRPRPDPSPQGHVRSQPSRSGLTGLRERVIGVGGTFAVHHRPDSFTIEASVPAVAHGTGPVGHA